MGTGLPRVAGRTDNLIDEHTHAAANRLIVAVSEIYGHLTAGPGHRNVTLSHFDGSGRLPESFRSPNSQLTLRLP